VSVRHCRINTTGMTFLHITAAICCTCAFFCPTSFSSDAASSGSRVVLVAPLYVSNDRFSSMLALANKTDNTVEVFVAFHSLEGDETARRPTTLAPHSSMSMDVDSVPMTQHRFATLGSISILMASPVGKALIGKLTIASRAGTGKIHIEEELQPVEVNSGPLRVGSVPASLSVPVLAIRSLNQLSQRISVICSDNAGMSYESHLLVPAHMTLLLNACIRGRSESRTYEQLLNGDTGPTRGDMTIKIKTADPQWTIAVWGFAAANVGVDSGLQLVGIEFAD